jgi:DNA-binding XRE family transcriptional regulator
VLCRPWVKGGASSVDPDGLFILFRRLSSRYNLNMPLPRFPQRNAQGLVNALEHVRASIAQDLVRMRREARLSQQELATLAGVRQETISRIESAKHTATPRVLNKLMRAMEKVSSERPVRKA